MSKATDAFPLDLPWIRPYYPTIFEASKSTGVPAPLIAGQLSRESGGGRLLSPQGPGGKGAGGELGLMQLNPKYNFIANWADPVANINHGASLDALYSQKYGGLDVGFAYYNTGTSAVESKKAGRDPDETTSDGDYYRDIVERAALFQADMEKAAPKGLPWWAWLLIVGGVVYIGRD